MEEKRKESENENPSHPECIIEESLALGIDAENKVKSARPTCLCLHRLWLASRMFYSKNREIVVIIILSAIWFLSNITILRSKEVRYQQYGPMFSSVSSSVADYPDGGLSFLHPRDRSKLDHLLMLYAPWDAESEQARPVFSALALLNPQLMFVAVACWNVSSDCWQRFHVSRFPAFALLLPGLNEVLYSGPVDVAHLQKFLSEAPLGYRTVASDAELLRYCQLYDNIVLGCYNLSAGEATAASSASAAAAGLHQFYAASVQSYDLFSWLPFLLPVYTGSERFHCDHSGQVILIRSSSVALTPDSQRPLRSSELLDWLQRHRQPPTLAALNSPGVKSRRLFDLATVTGEGEAGAGAGQSRRRLLRPLLLLFDWQPRHWESPALAWLRQVDAVYARGCRHDNKGEGESEGEDAADLEAALAAAGARAAAERNRLAEAALLGRVCADLAGRRCQGDSCHGNRCQGGGSRATSQSHRSAASDNRSSGCQGDGLPPAGCHGNANRLLDTWQRLYGQRPTESGAQLADLPGRLHRLCLIHGHGSGAAASGPASSASSASSASPSESWPQLPPTESTRRLRQLGCRGRRHGNATSAVALALVSAHRHPQLLRGLLGAVGPSPTTPIAVIVDLTDGGGSAHRLPGPVTGPAALTSFLLLHHQQQHHQQHPVIRSSSSSSASPQESAVTHLTTATLAAFALNSSRDALVLFQSPACIYCAPLLSAVARLARSSDVTGLSVGSVDVAANDLSAVWQPPRVPALLLFPRQAKTHPEVYTGSASSVAGLVAFVARHASGAASGGLAFQLAAAAAATAGVASSDAASDGNCPARWHAAKLQNHTASLQTRLNRALELAAFARDRLAEARWQLGRLTADLVFSRGVGGCQEELVLRQTAVRLYRRLLGRCQGLSSAYVRQRERTKLVAGRLMRLADDGRCAIDEAWEAALGDEAGR